MNERKKDEIIKTIIFEVRDIDKVVVCIDRIIEWFKKLIIFIERFSTHIQAKLAKEKRCHKCFKSNHKRNDLNAFCKNESTIIKEQIITQLIVLNIEWNEKKSAKYEIDLKNDASIKKIEQHHDHHSKN